METFSRIFSVILIVSGINVGLSNSHGCQVFINSKNCPKNNTEKFFDMTCMYDPKSWTFDYDENVVFENCEFSNHSDINKMSRLVRAENVEKLGFSNDQIRSLLLGIFDQMKELKRVDLSGKQFETLPADLFRENKKLKLVHLLMSRKFENLPSGLFKGLENLDDLRIEGCNLETLPGNLFQGLKNLRRIDLNNNAMRKLHIGIFDLKDTLEVLNLQSNEIENLPDNIFSKCENLKELNLSQNKITSISSSIFQNLRSLGKLFIQHNNITNIEKSAFRELKEVSVMNISHNNIVDLIHQTGNNEKLSVFHFCGNLSRLDLSFNKIPSIANDWMVEHSTFISSETEIEINLSNNNITKIDMSKDIVQEILKKNAAHRTLNLENNPIKCDHSLNDFVLYFDGRMDDDLYEKIELSVGSTKCFGPEELQDTLLSDLEPEKYKYTPEIGDYDDVNLCPKSCITWVEPFYQKLIFDCSYTNLPKAPETLCNMKSGNYSIVLNLTGNSLENIPSSKKTGYQAVQTLLLSSNQITKIPKDVFSPKLKTVELHDNRIRALSMETLKRINSSLKSITLGDNPWECNCEIRDVMIMIRNNNSVIKDVENVECENLIDELNGEYMTGDLCTEEKTTDHGSYLWIIIGLVILLLLCLMIGTIWFYIYRSRRKGKYNMKVPLEPSDEYFEES